MRYVFSDHLKQGMVLATDIRLNGENGKMAALLTQGQRLNQSYITKIRLFGVRGVMVEDNPTAEELGTKALVARAMHDITETYEHFRDKKYVLDESTVGKLATVSEDLVKQVMLKHDFAVSLGELESHDDFTYQHSLRVAILSLTLSIKLGLGRKLLGEIALSALLHDIGKMQIPPEITNKRGTLNAEEYELIKQHPLLAGQQLKEGNLVSDLVIEGVLDHHERMDGKGYPMGKQRNAISLFGRILAVCDVYEALQARRPYRDPWHPNDIIEYMMSFADTQFDCDILATFLKSVTPFPNGSIVQLSDGKKAVVMRNNPACILRPIVRVLTPQGETERVVNLMTNTQYTNVLINGLA